MTSDLMLAIKTIIIVSPNWRKVLKLNFVVPAQVATMWSHALYIAFKGDDSTIQLC